MASTAAPTAAVSVRREGLFEQVLVLPEQGLCGAMAEAGADRQRGTWRCVREGRVKRGEEIVVQEPTETLSVDRIYFILFGGRCSAVRCGVGCSPL